MRLKEELDRKLDEWRKRLLDVQTQSIRNAEERVWKILKQKRQKLAEEVRLRTDRHIETFQKLLEDKNKKALEDQSNVKSKLTKAQKFKEKQELALESAIALARRTAELREAIR